MTLVERGVRFAETRGRVSPATAVWTSLVATAMLGLSPELGRRLVGPILEMRRGQTFVSLHLLCCDLRHQQRVVGWSALQGRVHSYSSFLSLSSSATNKGGAPT